MSDQAQHWDKLHTKGGVSHSTNSPSKFAKEVNAQIPKNSLILELGCGVGDDAAFFAQKGHIVLATDFSKIAIEKNKARQRDGLEFKVLDISKPLEFKDGKFDVIYARLSLHYFGDKKTKEIFGELHRALKPKGVLCFLCKSIQDPLFGKGEKIEENFFEYKNHKRHFFSKDYSKECLKNKFKIKKLESGKEVFYNSPSAYIKVIAEKID